MDRSIAAEEFGKVLFHVGVEGAVNDVAGNLKDPLGQHKPMWKKVNSWYGTLPDDGKKIFRFAVKGAAVCSTFHIAALLDGASSYHYVEGDPDSRERPAEFAVSMNVYQNISETQLPQETVEICPTRHGEEVHDIMMGYVDEAEAEGFPQAHIFL